MSDTTYGTERGTRASSDEGTKDKAQQAVGQAQQKAVEKAHEVRGQMSERAREQVDQRSTQVGDQLTDVAQALRRTSDNLRSEGKQAPAGTTDAVAERAERLGSYLRESSGDRILDDLEDFARRQPWLVAAGGMAVGLVAARFLKASSSRRYESRYGGQQAYRGYEAAGYGSYGNRESYGYGTAPDADVPLSREAPLAGGTGAGNVGP